MGFQMLFIILIILQPSVFGKVVFEHLITEAAVDLYMNWSEAMAGHPAGTITFAKDFVPIETDTFLLFFM